MNHRIKFDRGIYDPTAISPLKAIVFDVFGTVVDWRGSVTRELAALGREHGIGKLPVWLVILCRCGSLACGRRR